ncbi:phosphoadenylyl-sulfate reductase [Halomonas sp. DQ26W]|uniref:phosphoadenylyl-sulfate reductase n=1 Tax=Halomonas sp. DQ26W TaxID=2282311 RepID=UPI000DF7FDF3|nr:phosphoadenylyl-sulfate reductase [Halomonas sp. DQ26W]RDB41898.1 phosphoadenylyl-sulfate reductase [Halomonas sp. DQ26W]
MAPFNTAQFVLEQDQAAPKEILRAAYAAFGELTVSFSGAEDVVLIDLALKVAPPEKVHVFSLDTGRLHAETYAFIERVRKHYGIKIDIRFPDTQAVQALVTQKGLYSFYHDGHQECCSIRKVAPLRERLQGLSMWVTGQRRDQSPGTRSTLQVAERDGAFGSEATPLFKINPLTHWTSEDVWTYIRMFDVPYNPLHERGFISIGCEPCTRPTLPHQHEREGRWWWEDKGGKECGLHVANLATR